MATANPYQLALAQRLAPQERAVVDPRAKLAEQLMNFKAVPVSTSGAGWGQILAAALSGGAGGWMSNQVRDDQQRERSEGLATLQRMSDQQAAEERAKEERQRQETGAFFASLGIPGFGAPPQQGAAAPSPGPAPGPARGAAMPEVPAGPSVPPAPVVGGDVRALNADAAAQRAAIIAEGGPDQEARLAAVSAGRAQAANGVASGTPFRANPGVGGVYAGLPAPTGAVPNLAASAGRVDPRVAAVAAAASGNPIIQRAAGALGAMGAAQEAREERATDNARQDARDRRQEEQWRATHALQVEAGRRAGLPAGYMPDGRGGAMPIPGTPQAQPAPAFAGNGMDPQVANTLLTIGAKPANERTPEEQRRYDVAVAEWTAPRATFDATTGQTVTVSKPLPAFLRPPEGAQATQAPRGQEVAPGVTVSQAPAVRGTPQSREAYRKAQVETGRVTDAMDNFLGLIDGQDGGTLSTYFNNPRSPEAQRVLGAFDTLRTAMRGEAFLNTGVLQPHEQRMLDETLLSPQSLRGLMASPETYRARYGEIRRTIQQGLDRQRALAGIPTDDASAAADQGGSGSGGGRMTGAAALEAARAKLGPNAPDDALVAEAQRIMGGGRGN